MVYTAIKKLVQYGLDTGLITETDRIYATNQLLEALKLEEYEEPEETFGEINLEETLKELLDYDILTNENRTNIMLSFYILRLEKRSI